MQLKLNGFTEKEALGYLLAGLQQEHDRVSNIIDDLRDKTGSWPVKKILVKPEKLVGVPAAAKPAKKKRVLSPEGRKRLLAALKRRWAKVKKAKKAAK